MAERSQVFIHPSSHVDERAEIGRGTKVWINVQVRENARIGADCVLSKDVYVDHGVAIGDGCKIQNGVSVYNGVTLGDRVFVGPHACFTNDKVPRAFNGDWQVTPTVVSEGASIGANVTIVCGVRIGEYAMVAAGSTVTKDVPAYSLVAGTPARQIGWISRGGHRLELPLRGRGEADCPRDGSRYRLEGERLSPLTTTR